MRKMDMLWTTVGLAFFMQGCTFSSMDATAMLQDEFNKAEEFVPYELILESEGMFKEHILVRDPDTHRVDTLEGDELFHSEFYLDGAVYEKNYTDKTIVKYEESDSLGPRSPKESLMQELEYLMIDHSVELIGDDKLLGRDVFKLFFQEQGDGEKSAEFWIDKETFVLLKSVYENEMTRMEMEATMFQVDSPMEDEWFAVEDDLFQMVNDEESYQRAEYEDIESFFSETVYLPDKEHNGWKLEETLLANVDEEVIKLVYIDQNEKEVTLFIQHEGEYELMVPGEEVHQIRENEVRFIWEPSDHSAYWAEEGVQYILFTKRDWEKEEAIDFIEAMSAH